MSATIILVSLALSTSLSAQGITTFDAPGAGTAPGQDPNAWMNIALNGAVAGFSLEPNNVVHGFVREAYGARWACPNPPDSNSLPTDAAT